MPLVIFTEDFDNDVLSQVVVQTLQKNLKLVLVKSPILDGDSIIEDLAICTGAKFV